MRKPVSSAAGRHIPSASRQRSRGQILVLFVSSIMVLMGMLALVVDVSWLWANVLRVQRAADAAALAGVVWLPGDPSSAYVTARSEATKNGYPDGARGIVVVPARDASNARQLDVRINGGLLAPEWRRGVALLPGPDRGRARRQDHGDQRVGPPATPAAWQPACRSWSPSPAATRRPRSHTPRGARRPMVWPAIRAPARVSRP